jgi:hypothetical protein
MKRFLIAVLLLSGPYSFVVSLFLSGACGPALPNVACADNPSLVSRAQVDACRAALHDGGVVISDASPKTTGN